MSREIFAHDGLYVTRYAGAASEGADRRRWQITIADPCGYVQLDARELAAFLNAVLNDVRDPQTGTAAAQDQTLT